MMNKMILIFALLYLNCFYIKAKDYVIESQVNEFWLKNIFIMKKMQLWINYHSKILYNGKPL